MSTSSPSLLIIDTTPPDQTISTYFTQFGFKIIHYHELSQLAQCEEHPIALLINWRVLEDTPTHLKTAHILGAKSHNFTLKLQK